jgi:PDZ domain
MRITRHMATRSVAVAVALAWLAPPATPQESLGARGGAQDRVRVSFGSGNALYVQVIPDGRAPMRFESDAPDAWVFQGDTAALVGKSYTIRVENRGRSRIKVVVGVDGVNAYYRKPLTGAADRDVGSILGPGQTRVLTGFQADERTAQRFVFSPEGFSEGAQVRGARIGEIEVHVYEEFRPEVYRSDRDRGQNSAAPNSSAPSPTIGTTAGDDVDSNVRRVSFTASTREPIARLELAYGRPEPEREPEPRRDDDRALGPLGVAVEQHPEGLRIVRVERDGLGDEMGLRDGDVITKVDTYARPSAQSFRRVLRQKRPGEYLFLEVLRGRHTLTFKARL